MKATAAHITPVTVRFLWRFSLQIRCVASLILTPEGTLSRLVEFKQGREIKSLTILAKAS